MFPRFRSKIRARGNLDHKHSFIDRTDWFSKKMKNEDGYEIAISDLDISENFDIWGK